MAAEIAAAAGTSNSVSSIQSAYTEALQEVILNHDKKSTRWPAEYIERAKAVQKQVQLAGDLDGWNAVDMEMKRFESARTIVETNLVTAPTALRLLQSEYLNITEKLALGRSREVMDLTSRHLARIEAQQKELTVAGKIDMAMAVNAEIKRVKALPEVTAAEFVLASQIQPVEAGAPITGSNPKLDATSPTNRPAGSEPPKEADSPKTADKIPARVKVTAEGVQLDNIPGVSFRRAAMTESPFSPMVPRLSVSTWTAESDERALVRVFLKTTKADTFVDGLTVTAQIFYRRKSRGLDRALPLEVEAQKVVLSRVAVKGRAIDFAPTPLPPVQDFYGVILSVFASDGKLEYQGVMPTSLKSAATTDMPTPKLFQLYGRPRRP
jgi:hypothetical protein